MWRVSDKGLVLVVEDEPAIAELQRMYLTREGFGVHVERDGVAGLAAARRLKPVAIVLDVGLPGMDGTEVCRALRDAGREVIYTGRMVDAQEALRWGLVNAVYPQAKLMDTARELAQTISAKSGLMIQYAKMCLNRALDQDLAGGLRMEADLFGLCFASEDQKEGMEAFLAKRPAQFKHC